MCYPVTPPDSLGGRWLLAEGGSNGLHVGLDSMTRSDVTTWAIVPSSLHCRHASQVKGQPPLASDAHGTAWTIRAEFSMAFAHFARVQ